MITIPLQVFTDIESTFFTTHCKPICHFQPTLLLVFSLRNIHEDQIYTYVEKHASSRITFIFLAATDVSYRFSASRAISRPQLRTSHETLTRRRADTHSVVITFPDQNITVEQSCGITTAGKINNSNKHFNTFQRLCNRQHYQLNLRY